MTEQQLDRDTWRRLLGRAAGLLARVRDRHDAVPRLTLGGGTVLMLRHEHRLSKDIDLFLHDVQWLTFFSPRLNDDVANIVSDYSEQANTLKLVFPEGDIDLIVASQVSNTYTNENIIVSGENFPLEATSEILAKKIYYRAASFRARDVFDLATAIDLDEHAALAALRAAATRLPQLQRRVTAMDLHDKGALALQILPLPGHEGRLATMRSTVLGLLQRML